MMKRNLIALGVAATLSVSAATTFADGGLTLSSSGASANILVFCGENGPTYQGLLPIPATGSLPTLPWSSIAFMFHGSNLQCTFKLDDKKPISPANTVGTAHLIITGDQGQIATNAEFLGYSAAITYDKGMPYDGQAHSTISVALHK